MLEKTILITGATDGIGKETAIGLAGRGVRHLILHGRSRDNLGALERLLSAQFPQSTFETIVADLGNLQEVASMAADLLNRTEALDVLINNAGVYSAKRITTGDNFELTFQVNFLSHVLLTLALLPLIEKSTGSRIVNVSSMTHQSANLDFENLQGEKSYEGYSAYATSKLLNVIFTMWLAKQRPDVSVNALHPGVINTKLLKAAMGYSGGQSTREGAATSIFLALEENVNPRTAGYFVNQRASTPSRLAMEDSIQDKTMRWAKSYLKPFLQNNDA